jgi:fumarylacetoacetase
MCPAIDHTHDPDTRSWIESANHPGADFPLQNLPFGLCRRRGRHARPHLCVAIGDSALDLAGCAQRGLLGEVSAPATRAFASNSLNKFMAAGQPHWSSLRRALHNLLRENSPATKADRKVVEENLLPFETAEFFVPAEIGDYTDFYASIFHAANVGKLFRPDHPLPANYKYVPIGYHGRASSIVISGTPVRRPSGQSRESSSSPVRVDPTRKMDYEAEIGFFVGPGNSREEHIPIGDAPNHIFGVALVNDWSARDIQSWEYQPLGPFLSKNFATSLSPWIVTFDALAPFRTAAFARVNGDPAPLPYLASPEDQLRGGLEITVEVSLTSEQMRRQSCPPVKLSHGNAKELYWTPAQLLAHHTVNGCNLRPGDLLASGTISGAAQDSAGCLLELTKGGAEPIRLPTGEERQFLEDGDEVILRAWCEKQGRKRIGLGECRGIVLPAR